MKIGLNTKRYLAMVLDLHIIAAGVALILFPFGFNENSIMPFYLLAVILVPCFVPNKIGATFGQYLLNLKLVDSRTGLNPPIKNLIIREIMFLTVFTGVGYLIAIFTGFYWDRISKTSMIETKGNIKKLLNFTKFWGVLKIQNIILIVTSILLLACSFFFLFRINIMNNYISNVCEKREYVAYANQEKFVLTEERRKEIEKSYDETCIMHDTDSEWQELRIQLSSNKCNDLKMALEQGYEIKDVPDEIKRNISRNEVQNYEKCLKNQQTAIKERPEEYKFLVIINAIILVSGLLLSFAFRK